MGERMQSTVALAVALWIGGASAAETWRVSEIAFESAGRGGAAVEMDAVFEFGDSKLRIPSFWDGGKSFKTRFAPPKAGEWKW